MKRVAKRRNPGNKARSVSARTWQGDVLAYTAQLPSEVDMSGRVHEIAVAIVAGLSSTDAWLEIESLWNAVCVVEEATRDGVGTPYSSGVVAALKPLLYGTYRLGEAAVQLDAEALGVDIDDASTQLDSDVVESTVGYPDDRGALLWQLRDAAETLLRAAAMTLNVTDDTAYSAGSALVLRIVASGKAAAVGEKLAPDDRAALVRLNNAADNIDAARMRLFSTDDDTRSKARELAARAQHIALGLDTLPRDVSDVDRIHFLHLAHQLGQAEPHELESLIERTVVVDLPTHYPTWGSRVTRDHLRNLARAWRPESDPTKPQKHKTAIEAMREVGLVTHSSHDAAWLREFEKRHKKTIRGAA